MWRMIWCNTGNGRRGLRDLGECEVKHGVRLHLVNLYAEPLGNPEVPEKFRQIAAAAPMPSPVVKPNGECRGMKSSSSRSCSSS